MGCQGHAAVTKVQKGRDARLHQIDGSTLNLMLIVTEKLSATVEVVQGICLAVQWLRPRTPSIGVWVPPLVRELRSYMLLGVTKKNVWQNQYSVAK